MSADCPGCGKPIPADQRYCGSCGADRTRPGDRSPGSFDATATSLPESLPTGSGGAGISGGQGRFAPGTMVSDRYRIIGLLGLGGMGEVYRADDLKLGRPVALKFLPERVERDPHRLSRFLNEVRTALRVSHPNVCRVHDINEVGGQHYISMEYVDGEDLQTLLGRIGHFPSERAVEIARQLCAGLAAAHAEGIVHRDLKPANVMIDGRGQVKITDFGLSGLAEEFEGKEIFAGTPSYMSPEQLAGKEVTRRSDIYSLGLVLYEVFTGRMAYGGTTLEEIRRSRSAAPTSPASHVHEIDPAAERVILRCLEQAPEDRPGSALAVAAALPGGDPLADALAAGETPDPQLVAEAGAAGGLAPRTAVAVLAAIVGMFAFVILASQRGVLPARADLPKPPAVLEEKAGEILRQLGYDEPPVDTIHTFEANWAYLNHHRAEIAEKPGGWDIVEQPQPAPIWFAYRQAPAPIVYESEGSIGEWVSRAAQNYPGEARLRLDPTGRLVRLDVTPPDGPDEAAAAPAAADWQALLAAAGLSATELAEAEPQWNPDSWADERRAWTGVYPDSPETEIRVEAAAYAGRPVSFRIIEPWTEPRSVPAPQTGVAATVNLIISTGWFVVALVVGSIVAWRNVRLGRGDHRTALRFALVLTIVRFCWLIGAHHYASGQWVNLLQAHVSWSMQRFGLAFVFYLALEPYARKLWPHMLTSWVRLFDRRFRDPLVGRDLLIGVAFGVAFTLPQRLFELVGAFGGQETFGMGMTSWTTESLRGFRHALTAVIGAQTVQILTVFIGIMMLFVFRLLFRRTWIMVLVFSTLIALSGWPAAEELPLYLVGLVSGLGLFWFVFFRFGLLSTVLGFSIVALLTEIPLTFDLTAWWSAGTWLVLLNCGAIAGWGFWAALAGRPVFKDEILGGG